MWKLFKRNRIVREPFSSSALGMLLQRHLERTALYLAAQTSKCSIRTLRFGLVFFCLAFTGFGGYYMYDSILHPAPVGSIHRISIPRQVLRDNDAVSPEQRAPIISAAEYARIHAFHQYLDSLRQDPKGKAEYDSILMHRPGLVDTLDAIEASYRGSVSRVDSSDN